MFDGLVVCKHCGYFESKEGHIGAAAAGARRRAPRRKDDRLLQNVHAPDRQTTTMSALSAITAINAISAAKIRKYLFMYAPSRNPRCMLAALVFRE